MKQNSILRAEARAALKGKWAVSALFTFVYCIVASIISSISGANYGNEGLMFGTSFIGMLLICPLAYGMIIGFLDVFRGNSLEIETLFSGYKSRIWGTLALKYIYIVLWTLLLIIPGIIKTYSYSMTEYILKDNPELKNNAAIEKSMEMMQGHKLRLFLLHLSFIGWAILAVLTFGIGFLWVIPYVETSQAAFYEDLKAQQEPIIEEV
ncbi:MAG: DUF975 family protein [Bacteroidaceae bacterium]|nr:DUF975 family protein [Bacteroidaceae bacterium]